MKQEAANKTAGLVATRRSARRSGGASARLFGTLIFLFVLVCWTTLQAASIRQIGTNELLDLSKLIVHGHVVDKWAESHPRSPDAIVTKVVVRIDEVLKGEVAEENLTLTFLGGELGAIRQYVDGSNVPDLGEEGVYFVEDPDKLLINPLYGWTQGHFIVNPVDGSVRTASREAVFDLRLASGPAKLEFAHAHASGVRTEAVPAVGERPLSVDEFKSRIRDALATLE